VANSTRAVQLLKGAIVAIDPANPLASVIVFQYNPSTLTRDLQARAAMDDGARAEALRLGGAPIETIALEVEIDATDQLAQRSPAAITMGIYPQLSALEMLIYPKSSLVIANNTLAALGTIELIGPQAPLTLFIWGLKRVVPVRITALNIAEEAYDTQLNPIRARVGLSLRVLSYTDLQVSDPAYTLFLAYQVAKETMATLGSVQSLNSVLGSDVSLL
jgi:hypothetical protein